jgi:hypothetical protein
VGISWNRDLGRFEGFGRKGKQVYKLTRIKQPLSNPTHYKSRYSVVTYRGITEELQGSYRGVTGEILAYSSLTTPLQDRS